MKDRFVFYHHSMEQELYTARLTKSTNDKQVYVVMWEQRLGGLECSIHAVEYVEMMIDKGYWIIKEAE